MPCRPNRKKVKTDVIREGKERDGQQTYLLQLQDKHNNTLIVELAGDGTYWDVNSAGIFRKTYSRRKNKVQTVPAVGGSIGTDTPDVNSGQTMGATAPAGNSLRTSTDKDNADISEKQEGAEKYLSLSADNRNNGISERISTDFNGTEVEENGRLGEAAGRYRSGGTPSREDARGTGSPLSREEEERIGERYAKVGILRWIVDAGCAIAITEKRGTFLRHNGPIPLTASPPP